MSTTAASTNAAQTRHTVTAVIVAHNGARLLPALVQALQAQTFPVQQTVGIDTASRDRSGAVLAELIGSDAVFGMNRTTGYGEAVAVALKHATRRRSAGPDPSLEQAEWVWLLHDDCEPAPETLERLLRAAARDPSVAVAGPKVLDGQDRRTLREAGVSIDRAGRRVTGIDKGEIDQGQHDHKRDVLAVGSAGMLVRRDAWDRLGGFDPGIRLLRDDVDFCWRAQAAGYRVQVITDAVLYHRELTSRRRRPAAVGDVRQLDRRNALFVLAANLPLLTMLWMVGGCVVGSLARACYFLLTKQLDQSAAYAYSVASLLGHPVQLARARRRRAPGHAAGYNAVRVFIPPARTLFRAAERIAGLISTGPPQQSGGRHQASADESGEDAQFTDTQSAVRRLVGHPGVQLFTVLLAVALIAERRLLGASPLGGGALVPAWGGAPALWREYLAGFHAASVGSTASAPPYLAVVAALATVCGGQAWLAVDLLLLGCVPLAGLAAYLASRWLVRAAPARVLLAAAYALIPVATGAVAAGRLGTAVAFILLPLIAVSAGRMLTAAPRQARRAAWAAGLLIAVAAAFVPLAWVLGTALVLVALAARRWLVALDPVNAAIVVLTPFLVLFPWSLHLLSRPSAFLTEAGVSPAGLTTPGLPASAVFALSPGGPGLPPPWVTLGFVLAPVALLLSSRLRPGRRTGLAVAGWTAAVAGLLTAVIVSRVSVTPAGGGQPTAGWPGLALALAALGLLLASAAAVEMLVRVIQNGTAELSPPLSPAAGSPAAGSPTASSPAAGSPAAGSPAASSPAAGKNGRRRLLAGTALVAVASVPLLVAGYWVTAGVRGPVNRVSAQVLPAFVAASAASGPQYRTLVLRTDAAGELSYAVVRQSDPTLGEPELGSASAAGAALNRVVAALGSADEADAGDPGRVLGEFGVKYVLLPSPVDSVLAQRLDAAIGLEALSKAPTYDLWQVSGTVARASVVAADGAVTALSSGPVDLSGAAAPASGGTLILAEPYGGWTARLNGHALQPVTKPANGWAQAFVLPPGGGTLSVTRDNLARHLSLLAELIALLAVCLLALPGKRTDPVQEAQALAALREARDSRRAAVSARRGASPPDRAAGPFDRLASSADGDAQRPAAVADPPAVSPDRPADAPDGPAAAPAGGDRPLATVDAGRPPASAVTAAEPRLAAADADPWPAVTAVEAWLAAENAVPPVLAAPPAEPDEPEPWAQESRTQALPAQEPESSRSDPLAPGSPEPRTADPWGSAAWDLASPSTEAWTPQPQAAGAWGAEPESPAPQVPDARSTGGWNYDALSTGTRAPEPPAAAEPWTAEREDVDTWLSGLRGSDARDAEPLGSEARQQPEPQGVSEWRLGPSGAGAWHSEPSGPGEWPAEQAPEASSRIADPLDAGAWPAERPSTGAWDMAGDWSRAGPTGEQPAAPTGEQPAAPTGGQPAARTGEQPAARTGEQPAVRAPWESDPWGGPPDAGPVPERTVTLPEQAEPPPGSGAYPAAAQPARPERHSHRAKHSKHSKPSRWRGNHSGGDGSD